MILLRSFLSGHIRIKRTLEYYDAGIGPRVPFGGGFGPTVSANFAVALGDFTTLSSTSTMPTGGSISRAGNAMLYDSTGKLTYAPNNLYINSGSATNTARTITTQVGVNYYIWIQTSTGTATIVASGTNTSTFNGSTSGTYTAFTATAGTLTLTPTSNFANITQVVVAAVTYETALRSVDNVVTSGSAYYGPRFDYDPATLAAKGLLVEGTRTNLLNFSQSFATSGGAQNNWADTNITRNSTNNTSPDGTGNALRVTASAANGTIISSAAIGTSAQRVLSVWLRRVTGTGNIQYTLDNGSNWTTQAITSTWARYSFAATTANQQAGFRIVTSGDAIEIWGVQLEAAAFSSSYVFTDSSTVARAAETFSLTGYANRLVEAFYIDEETGGSYSGNSALSTGTVTISPPTFGWVTSLRAYQNAYAGSISTPSWLSFSRAGNAMMTDSTGTLTWAPANLLTYSQDFRNTAAAGSARPWIWGAVTVSPDVAIAPDGTTTADNIISTVGTGEQRVFANPIPSTVGIRYTYSVYAKTGGANWLVMRDDARGFADTSFDLVNGVVGTVGSGRTASILSVGSGWYRCSVTVEVSASWVVGSISLCLADVDNGRATFVGNGVKSIYLWGAQLEAVTYQTAPSAYIPTTSAAVYGPRYDYDPSTVPATPRGLLIEEQRSNLIAYSQQFDNAAWIKSNGGSGSVPVVTANQATSPDGTPSADLSVFNAGSNGSGDTSTMEGPVFSASAQPYTFSLWMRTLDGSTKTVRISISGAGASNVTVTGVWQRFQTTWNASAGSWNPRINLGDGVTSASASLYIWGAQVEAGAFATSFIPTVATAPVTRAADVAQLTGSALTVGQGSAGTAIVQFSTPTLTGTEYALSYDNSGTSIYANTTFVRSIGAGVNSGGSGQANLTFSPAISANTVSRAAFAWTTNSFAAVANNGTVQPDPSGILPVGINVGYLGLYRASPLSLNGPIASVALYNQRLPDAILKQKSTVGAPY